MPIDDYKCLSCQNKWETIVNRDEKPSCPACQSYDVEKLISGFGGYQGNLGSASTRPKSAGYRRKQRH